MSLFNYRKPGYYYGNYNYYNSKTAYSSGKDIDHGNDIKVIGHALNFASREAYKQLRTNLDFSLAEVEGCRCIGITSPMRGDGKSLTAINLSFSLAEDGYKVLLIEGDMRIPTIARKINIDQKTGLSNILSSTDSFDSLEILSIGDDDNDSFNLLIAGSIPPNPQELLGSKRMAEMMEYLKRIYDYIIVDLPPVTAVADALVASKILEGMLLIVRHDHTERGALSESIRQLEFSGIRILGFVFNAANNDDSGYSRRYKYRYRRYKNYRYGYNSYNSYNSGYYRQGKESD